jgi:hypothetical protein
MSPGSQPLAASQFWKATAYTLSRLECEMNRRATQGPPTMASRMAAFYPTSRPAQQSITELSDHRLGWPARRLFGDPLRVAEGGGESESASWRGGAFSGGATPAMLGYRLRCRRAARVVDAAAPERPSSRTRDASRCKPRSDSGCSDPGSCRVSATRSQRRGAKPILRDARRHSDMPARPWRCCGRILKVRLRQAFTPRAWPPDECCERAGLELLSFEYYVSCNCCDNC